MATKAENIKRRQWAYLTDYLKAHGITYQEYLHGEHWQDVRRRFWACKLHNKTCQVCGGRDRLQVHHQTYKRIGRERLTDLCLLCDNCHGEAHRIERERPNGILLGAVRRLKKDRKQPINRR